ncbi:MAG: DJ-1/PfpI family protein [Pseudomonadota bacterium]
MPKIAVILTPGFADWEYAFIAGIGGPFYGMDVGFFAPSPGEVTSQGGLTAKVTRAVDEIAEWAPDVVVAVGGMVWDSKDAPDVAEVLTSQHERGATIAGICGGTLALARAGLLDEVRHTSNAPDFLSANAPGYGGAARYEASAKAVVDGAIVTAPGTAAVSFTSAVFDAAGLDDETVGQFLAMTAAEHR